MVIPGRELSQHFMSTFTREERNSLCKLTDVGKNSKTENLVAYLNASTQPQDQVKCGLLLDVVVSQGAPILQLLSSKDQPLLVRRNAYSDTRALAE